MSEMGWSMRIAVFDDESFFCNELETLLHEFFALKHGAVQYSVAVFTIPEDFTVSIESQYWDVVFLDIAVEGSPDFGIRKATKIRQREANCHIVFVTSDSTRIQEALSGLIRPSQFIVKPLARETLFPLMDDIVKSELLSENNLLVTYGRYDYILQISDIITVQKEGRKTVISSANRRIEVTDSLESIFARLPDSFVYIDKGTIANMRQVSEADFPNRQLLLKNNTRIFMSRNARGAVEAALNHVSARV